MIRRLLIRNFILVREIELEFDSGLQALTGETGVGKSVIVGALALALGDAPKGPVLCHTDRPAYLEAVFDRPDDSDWPSVVEEFGLDSDETEIVIAREIHPSNTSRFFLNGRRSTLSVVRELRRRLLEFQSQRDQSLLFEREVQLEFLDRYGDHTGRLEAYRAAFRESQEARRRLEEIRRLQRAEQEKQALYEYQCDELGKAGLRIGEDEALEAEQNLLRHAEDIRLRTAEFEGETYDDDNSIFDRLNRHLRQLSAYAGDSEHLRDACAALQSALDGLDQAVGETRRMRGGLEGDEDRLGEVEARLDELNRLKFKYKRTIPELVEYLDRIRNELDAFTTREDEILALERGLDGLDANLRRLGTELSTARRETATRMQTELQRNLRLLAIPEAVYLIDLSPLESGTMAPDGLVCGPDGCDEIVHRFSANPGKPPEPLSHTASGGELSRILLTVKKVLAERDLSKCIVFDEVDSGIGGKTADILGEFISEISRRHQVLCITHLPQVAVYAKNHFVIEKKIDAGETVINVIRLETNERMREIARMLSGDITEVALTHAEEMLNHIHKKGKSHV
jgi:DNA repair protein RecN (Recombination protein N)